MDYFLTQSNHATHLNFLLGVTLSPKASMASHNAVASPTNTSVPANNPKRLWGNDEAA